MAKKLNSITYKIFLTRFTLDQFKQLQDRRERIGVPIAVQIRNAVSDYLKEDGGA